MENLSNAQLEALAEAMPILFDACETPEEEEMLENLAGRLGLLSN